MKVPKPKKSYFGNDNNMEDEDDDEDNDDEMYQAPPSSKKDAEDSSDDEELDGESTNEKSKRENADRSRFFQATAALKKQGIDLEVEADDVDEDEDGYKEYMRAQRAKEAAEKARDDQDNPTESKSSFTKEQMENLFGKKENEQFESFTMGASAGRGYGSVIGDKGQVKTEVDKRDAWLLELDETQKGGEDQKKSDANMDRIFSNRAPKKAKPAKADEGVRRSDDPLKCRQVLLEYMTEGENVLRTLRRLGGNQANEKQRGKNRQQRKRTKPRKDGDVNAPGGDQKEEGNKKGFLEVTEAANTLLNQGTFGIYQQKFADIELWTQRFERHLQAKKEAEERAAAEKAARERAAVAEAAKAKAEAEVASSKRANKGMVWEYKWAADDDETHGPFEGDEMTEWRNEGYFDSDVVLRQVGATEWKKADEVLSFVEAPANKRRKTDFKF